MQPGEYAVQRVGTPPPIDSRAAAAELDRVDPLASFRDEFAITQDPLVYMDGNSLGRPPASVLDALTRVVSSG